VPGKRLGAITDRDLAVLGQITKYGRMTRDQAARLFFKTSTGMAGRCLRRMTEAGYLRELRIGGKLYFVPSAAGARLVGLGLAPPSPSAPRSRQGVLSLATNKDHFVAYVAKT